MTKIELIDFLRIRVGTLKNNHERFIEMAVNIAMNELIGSLIDRRRTPDQAILSNYVVPATLDILHEGELPNYQYYCELPFNVLITDSIPNGIYEIVRVNPPFEIEFVPTSPIQLSIQRNLPGNRIDKTIGYYLIGKKVFFEVSEYSSMVMDDIKKLTFMLVKDFTEIGENDTIFIPFKKDLWLVEKVLMIIDGTPPQKKLIDTSTQTI